MSGPGLGVAAALVASAFWGCGPIFFSFLTHVPPLELLAHRVVWGAVTVGLFCLLTARGPRIWAALRDRRQVLTLLGSSLLIAVNWFTFLWSVQAGRVTEAGIGYYLMPLVAVLLGVLVLRERLSSRQWAAVGTAGAAVGVLSVGLGAAPWLPLTLATSFAVYGLIRKRAETGAITGFLIETILLLPLALGWLLAAEWGAVGPTGRPGGLFGADGATTALLIVSGLYTGLPLILFAEAARRLTYATTGMVQYLNPTLQVASAGLVLGEAFTPWHFGALGLIWLALGLYTLELMRLERASRMQAMAAAGVAARST